MEFESGIPALATAPDVVDTFKPEPVKGFAVDGGGGVAGRAEDLRPEDLQLREDARLSQLQIDDPISYEQEMIDRAMGDTD